MSGVAPPLSSGQIDRVDGRPSLLRALRHRNYRLFFAGQSLSLVGTWITRIATGWLVYRLTGSALLLGIVGFCGQIPTLFLAPVAGVFVDRWDRHRVLVVTQVLSMLQSLALAVLALSGIITVPMVLGLLVCQGVINAFDTPARQAFVVAMIEDRADLPNAIALNSSMVNVSRILGPSIGGVLIAAVGEGWCFLLDAISYLAVIASLVAMRVPARALPTTETRVAEELRAGFAYVVGFAPIGTALLLLALVSTMGMPYTVLMPAIAAKVLHGGPHTLGLLMAAAGVGALGGAGYLASRRTVVGLGRVIAIASGMFGAALMAFSRSHDPLALAAHPAARGRGIHGLARRDQHRRADDYGGAFPRPGDGVLHDGLPRHRAAGEPPGRRAGGPDRGARDHRSRRRRLRSWLPVVRQPAAQAARAGPADLRGAGDHQGADAGGGDRGRVSPCGVGGGRTDV